MAFITHISSVQSVWDRVVFLGPLFLIVWIFWIFVENLKFKAKYRFPNVVPGLPILGNVHQLPTDAACLHFEKLAEKYGEM